MPQLMPLNWVNSFFMMFLLFIMWVINYFFKKSSISFNFLNKKVNLSWWW